MRRRIAVKRADGGNQLHPRSPRAYRGSASSRPCTRRRSPLWPAWMSALPEWDPPSHRATHVERNLRGFSGRADEEKHRDNGGGRGTRSSRHCRASGEVEGPDSMRAERGDEREHAEQDPASPNAVEDDERPCGRHTRCSDSCTRTRSKGYEHRPKPSQTHEHQKEVVGEHEDEHRKLETDSGMRSSVRSRRHGPCSRRVQMDESADAGDDECP